MPYRNIIGSLAFIGLAGFICAKSVGLDIGTSKSPGPGFMPFIGSIVLIFLNGLFIITEFVKRKEEPETWEFKWKRVLPIFIAIVVYASIVHRLGYIITTFLAMALFFKVSGYSNWLLIILNSIIATLLTYIIFNVWLNSGLPKGLLGI
jgi:hypothetical protein